MRNQLTDSVRLIPGVGPKLFEGLQAMGIYTFEDIIGWYPRRYIDGSAPTLIANLPIKFTSAIRVTIQTLQDHRSPRGLSYFDARAEDESGEIILRWFNQPYLKRKLEIGTEWVIIGAAEYFRGELQMVNPRVVEEPEIIPLYPQTKQVTSTVLRGFIEKALELCELEDPLPVEIRQTEGLPNFADAMRAVHLPQTSEEIRVADRYIAFQETFSFFIDLLASKGSGENLQGIPIEINVEWLRKAVDSLPFILTDGQKRVIWDALQEMRWGKLMTRLLNGDVGSGKTAVAAIIAAVVASRGYKTVLLAPTEILAKQHSESISKLLKTAGVKVGLYTAAQKDVLSELDIIIGTHAVLQPGVEIKNLGLIVIDEQHRFGVRQRAQLRNAQNQVPHVLSMTATPIPRTLALVLFADLTVSFLRERPKDRLAILTKIIYPRQREELHRRLITELKKGHQAFVLCPLIEEKSEEEGELTLFSVEQDKKTVLKEVERLRSEHPEYGVVEAIHGKMKATEKREIMERMAKGEINILVATSVIEVGVDIPNATIMVVENAERFGLAQLHQIRGRVGRGPVQSYCLLCPSHPGGPAIDRLQVLVDYQSGFDVAEKDLALRGPGDLTGLNQSGLPSFKMARLTDLEFLSRVKHVAEEYAAAHPEYVAQQAKKHYSSSQTNLE